MTAERRVRVALIGAGNMANNVHYPSLAEFPDVEMVGLCDLVEEKLHATADKFAIEKRYSDYRLMLEETQPEAVYILMPPNQLYDIAVDCLEAGLHLFLEKPPGITTHQIIWLAKWAEKNGVQGMVGFNRRYIPLMRHCRDLVVAHGGPIHQAVATFYKWMDEEMHPYYRGAVDILTSDCVHAVDTLRFLGGEVDRLASSVKTLGQNYDMAFNALLEFENGATGILMGNWRTGGRMHQFEMHARGISAFVNPDFEAKINRDGALFVETIDSKEFAGSDQNYKYYGFWNQARHFIDCVKAGTEPETSFPDAIKTMELVDRIYASRI
ncbi:MAG TPA: Gfo/Idh/MocA family oxidoreductase [Armatimonadota bacterium]|jgi:predicted dehydrogenase